ncbi:hypothetical protein Tdes44962_MAKER01096 [Teratosphaeria destructans]|uniref:Uncharacterized protein n=1 Tax=Teratosphaeria destructans TaxID=418781 RepID=A0A9W7SID2_9PEZI|nr:hypothetical protein Tdes44962_MAKER01096 [Teratosphaeria destructans]
MDVRESDQEDRAGVFAPVRGGSGDDFEGDEEREGPELAEDAEEEALVELFGEPGPEEELDDEEDVGGDCEEVGAEGAEAEGFELEGQVLGLWVLGYSTVSLCEREGIEGGHAYVWDCPAETLGDGLEGQSSHHGWGPDGMLRLTIK